MISNSINNNRYDIRCDGTFYVVYVVCSMWVIVGTFLFYVFDETFFLRFCNLLFKTVKSGKIFYAKIYKFWHIY